LAGPKFGVHDCLVGIGCGFDATLSECQSVKGDAVAALTAAIKENDTDVESS